ncbi:reverse transcriptase domain-containing protein [Tanacetum coccineum]
MILCVLDGRKTKALDSLNGFVVWVPVMRGFDVGVWWEWCGVREWAVMLGWEGWAALWRGEMVFGEVGDSRGCEGISSDTWNSGCQNAAKFYDVLVNMDDPNITMEEYIRLEEEKARRHGKVYNWETATYGRIWDDDEVHNLRSVETKFLAIVFDDTFTSQATLSFEPTVSPLNDNEIDVKISFHESDDEDYTPTVSYFDDLDYLKDFENEFPAIVYNDALTSKSDFLTEPTVNPQHIDEFNETSLSVYDEEEQNEKLVSKNGYDVFDMTLPPRDRDISILGLRVWSIQGLIDLMAEGLSARMLMEHKDAQGQSVFTNRAWKRLFEIVGFGSYWVYSARQIPDKGDLKDY